MKFIEKIFKLANKRFFWRMFFAFSTVIIIGVLSIIFFSKEPLQDFNILNLKKNLLRVSTSLETKTNELYKKGRFEELEKWIDKMGEKLDMRITIITTSGKVLADSEKDHAFMENHKDRPEIAEALRRNPGHSIRFSSTINEHMLYVAKPVIINGEVEYVIRLSLYLDDISRFIKDLKKDLTKILLIFLLIALILSWYIAQKLHKPVNNIIEATRSFSLGNYDTKLYMNKNDEFSVLAESFNNMVEKQEFVVSHLTEREAELSTIISSMDEGLLVISMNGEIVLTNRSFEKMTGVSVTKGQNYWEVFRLPGFEDHIKLGYNSENSIIREIEFHNTPYLTTYSKIKGSDKLVITFRNVSEFKNLEKMKKDFILNLSHELKTPLTAIMGFIETLEDEENIKNNYYIEIIKRHTERMNLIVSDLMVISELEEKGRNFEFAEVDLAEMLGNIIKIFQDKISSRKIALNMKIDDTLPRIKGEKFKLEQMFINLIDNAVKYTEKGEINISLTGTGKSGSLKFSINNTGYSIPEKSIPRIFERFYVVDKSRSRKVGGTGLGLSIVKHVVQIHKGEITVESNERTGITFTVTLPL